jgi:hypothetical protein
MMLTHTAILFLGLLLGAFLGIFLHAILSVSCMADQCSACRIRLMGQLTANDRLWLDEEPARLDLLA